MMRLICSFVVNSEILVRYSIFQISFKQNLVVENVG